MKKKKLLIIAGIIVIGLSAAALVWYFVWGKNKPSDNQETVVKIQTSVGQEVVYAQLTSVKGNEITYTVAEEARKPVSGEMPQKPEGFERGERGEKQGQSTYAFSYNGTNYQLTEESCTKLIPVGTEVTTKLGTVTTFSRLAAGDNVALVMEQEGDEQVIVAVYIIG